jgi:hypothetical protein
MWTCPYCREPMPLTWRRYFLEPGIRHRCAHCRRISRLNKPFSPKLLALRILGTVAGAILGIAVARPFDRFADLPSIVACLFGALAIGLPVDKYADGRHQLIGIEGEKPVGDEASCVECGRIFKLEHMITHSGYHVCAQCKPLFLQKLSEGGTIAPPPTKRET